MGDQTSMSYIFKIVGAIAGLATILGVVLKFTKRHETSETKASDVRLNLRVSLNSLHADLSQLGNRIDTADVSRQRLAAATGRVNSGMMEHWKKEVAADKIQVNGLRNRAPAVGLTFHDLNLNKLESKFVEVNRIQIQVDRLKAKYDASLQEDNRQREQLQQAVNARHPPKP